MARANLASLLGNIDDTSPENAPAHGASEGEPQPTAEAAHEPARPSPNSDSLPLYLRLVRKEARLREEQYAALTEHARKLTRRRRGRGARITENTLIRIAIDLLLARVDTAAGNDEREILESLL